MTQIKLRRSSSSSSSSSYPPHRLGAFPNPLLSAVFAVKSERGSKQSAFVFICDNKNQNALNLALRKREAAISFPLLSLRLQLVDQFEQTCDNVPLLLTEHIVGIKLL